MPCWPSSAQSTLKSLSVVNRTLCSVAQPALFRHIHLYGDVAECYFRVRQLLQMITTYAERGSWIKILRLGWRTRFNHQRQEFEIPGPSAPGEPSLMDTVSELFNRLTRLTIFRADSFKITPQIYAHLFRLPTLRTVRCYQRWLEEGPMEDNALNVDDLTIEDLNIVDTQKRPDIDTATAKLARSPRIRKLEAGIDVCDKLFRDSPRTFDNLTELIIETLAHIHVDCFADILSACGKLESIIVTGTDSPQLAEAAERLSKQALPFLSRVHLPVGIAEIIIPGRPVETIIVQAQNLRGVLYQWSRASLSLLTSGSVTVKELSLLGFTWKDDGMDIIFELFPYVETLKVQFFGKEQPVSWAVLTLNSPIQLMSPISLGYKTASSMKFVASRTYGSYIDITLRLDR